MRGVFASSAYCANSSKKRSLSRRTSSRPSTMSLKIEMLSLISDIAASDALPMTSFAMPSIRLE